MISYRSGLVVFVKQTPFQQRSQSPLLGCTSSNKKISKDNLQKDCSVRKKNKPWKQTRTQAFLFSLVYLNS